MDNSENHVISVSVSMWISMVSPNQSGQPVALTNPAMSFQVYTVFCHQWHDETVPCKLDWWATTSKQAVKEHVWHNCSNQAYHMLCNGKQTSRIPWHWLLKAAWTTLWMRSSWSHYILTVSTEVTGLSDRWLQYTATKCEWRRLIENERMKEQWQAQSSSYRLIVTKSWTVMSDCLA